MLSYRAPCPPRRQQAADARDQAQHTDDQSGDRKALACARLGAGASRVVGALWDVNDWLAGKILASAYPDFAAGMDLAQAVRAAYLRRREAVTGAALAVLGLPDR